MTRMQQAKNAQTTVRAIFTSRKEISADFKLHPLPFRGCLAGLWTLNQRTRPVGGFRAFRLDLHMYDAVEQPSLAELWPPVVKKNLNRPPHTDPAKD